MRLADLRYPDAEARLKNGAVALWPVGATEAHGPHLPLDTDVRIASAICERAVPALQDQLGTAALLLPPLAYSVTDCARPFSGTLSVPAEAVEAYVEAVARAALSTGFRAVCLVNAHLEPAHRHALRNAVQKASTAGPVVLADPGARRFVPKMSEEFRSGACHAGQYETSIMLAAYPELVKAERARTLPPKRIDILAALKQGQSDFEAMGADQAYLGDPAAASAKEGAESLRTLVDIVVTTLREVLDHDACG